MLILYFVFATVLLVVGLLSIAAALRSAQISRAEREAGYDAADRVAVADRVRFYCAAADRAEGVDRG